ncbi:MAG: oligosaccharide flippase family protein [Bradyrhizobium sp.]|nr:oligosaccharide flippase family protein [Bradyrhizobium sp.]
MTDGNGSYRRILKSTGIVGSASVVNMVLGIARLKLFAVLLGPSGVGLLGLFANIMMFTSTIATLGMATSGLRQIASTGLDDERRTYVLQALLFAGMLFGSIGGMIVVLLREIIAIQVMGDARFASGVGWIGLGVAASVIGTIFSAALQGLHRIGDFARVVVAGSSIGTIAAVATVWCFGIENIHFAAICLPVATACASVFYIRKLLDPRLLLRLRPMFTEISAMLRFGGIVLVTTALSIGVIMATRSIIARDLGFEAAGHFHAVWLLSATYIGLLLTTMTSDFYPRLTAIVAAGDDAGHLINGQTLLNIKLVAPFIVGIVAFAPIIIAVLYSAEFAPAAEVLQFQVIGDLFRVVSFPFAFALLVSNSTGRYFTAEVIWSAVYILAVHSGLDRFGLLATGYAYLASCAVYALLVVCFARPVFRLQLDGSVIRAAILALVLALATLVAARFSAVLGFAVGIAAIFTLGIAALRFLLAVGRGDGEWPPDRLVKLLVRPLRRLFAR